MSKSNRALVTYREPVVVETFALVTSSIVLNQGVKDDELLIAPNAAKHSEFNDFKGFKKQQSRPLRTDPKGVEIRLDEVLADADSKSRHLDASAADSTTSIWSYAISPGLPVAGILLIVLAGVLRWKAR